VRTIAPFAAGCAAAILLAASASVAQTPPPAAPVAPQARYSACVWNKVSGADRQSFLNAYRADMQKGMAVLTKLDAASRRDFAACVGRSDAPSMLVSAAVASEAIQYGAADHLSASRQITRAQLDAAWAAAPAAARTCVIAQAAKPFGLNATPCPDNAAPLWFTAHFKVADSDRTDASQVLFYYVAKAQSGWTQGLVQQFLRTAPKA
jgi:hypothetical protein